MTRQAEASESVLRLNLENFASEWSAQEYTRRTTMSPIEAALVERDFPPAPATVLDLGCGAGRTSGDLHARGYRVVAIDLAASLLALARDRYPEVPFLEMDARMLAFSDASFDAVLFSYNGLDTIYPEAARVACLREIRRVLKPGAPLVFSSHNLVGSCFSGGFTYVRGYVNAARFLASQRGNGLLREWYVRYIDGGGPQYLFSALPSRTLSNLAEAGFDALDVAGDDGERRRRRVALRYQHVHFAARRPPAA